MKISTFGKLMKNPFLLIPMGAAKGWFREMDDGKYLEACYRAYFGKKLNLDNPRTFNEKIQWLKLNDRNPRYTDMVDKYKVKKWVASQIGDDHIVPTFTMWETAEEIDISALPNQFVLKTNHDSGGVVICRDKGNFDLEAARAYLSSHLRNNFFYGGREWPYKDVKPVIFAEKYLDDFDSAGTPDYKFFCFNGEVKALFVATDRFSDDETKFDFFDDQYNHLPFTNGHPNASVIPPKPVFFDEMKEAARKLSAGIPQVRVDFYETEDNFYFGELTFSHWSGFVPFNPEEWDEVFGSWIELPKIADI